jgi:hypothetical protein
MGADELGKAMKAMMDEGRIGDFLFLGLESKTERGLLLVCVLVVLLQIRDKSEQLEAMKSAVRLFSHVMEFLKELRAPKEESTEHPPQE